MSPESFTLPEGMTVFERGWLSSNNILFVGRDETVLVDTGYVSHAAQTLALIEQALSGRLLDRVVNTHLHSDHCGGNAALQTRYPAVRTAIPPGEASCIANWDEDRLTFRATGQRCPRFRFEDVLESGAECRLADRLWEVHGAPGHDPHSIILFEPESRTLISADALWENGFGIAFPELVGEASFDDVGRTLDRIEALNPLYIIPGHGRVFGEVGSALGMARHRLDGLRRNPEKHARHAIKVLIKFKLLELQATTRSDWAIWIERTPYFELIRRRFFSACDLQSLCEELLSELCRSGAAIIDDDFIRNH